MNTQSITQLCMSALVGALLVVLGIYLGGGNLPFLQETESDFERLDRLKAQYYASEVATLVSPHSIRERMDEGDESFILVDTRAKEDYERAHIVGAINIDSSQSFADVLDAYKALDDTKQIIIYCYSASCMNGRKVGNFLAENGFYVQEMTVGWNEWRYDWEGWNYDTEWNEFSASDYVVSGSEPGKPTVREEGHSSGCPIGGSLGC